MKHKLVVFDWNGTLLSDTALAWRASNECLKFYGAPPITLSRFRETFTFPILHFYKLNGVSVDQVLAQQDEGNAVFQAAYLDASKRCRTRQGARGLLDFLEARGIARTILSNSITAQIENHLKRLKLDHYFQHVCAHTCDGTTILHKTSKKERLSAYLVKRGYKPEDVVIIGDSMEEPEIAQHLGLTSIGILDGSISRARMKAAQPDYIVKRLDEVQGILQQIWALPD